MALILHQSGGSHGHGHSHAHGHALTSEPPARKGRKGGHAHGNTSVRAAFVHVLGDLLHSVGVLTAAAIIHPGGRGAPPPPPTPPPNQFPGGRGVSSLLTHYLPRMVHYESRF